MPETRPGFTTESLGFTAPEAGAGARGALCEAAGGLKGTNVFGAGIALGAAVGSEDAIECTTGLAGAGAGTGAGAGAGAAVLLLLDGPGRPPHANLVAVGLLSPENTHK
jgi:hypothetical protein